MKRLLIANRGEIACRIIKSARALGITTIAIYSTADQHALHTQLADEAYHIGESPATDSYLAIDKIIKLAKSHEVDAIHPGYGFLAENEHFAAACEHHEITFVGPSAKVIAAMGSKAQAKALLADHVAVIPGYHGDDQDPKTLLAQAKKIGFPILLKAALGGGGKGMRIVETEKEFTDALAGAQREALKSFNDERMIIEKYISNPRHIECQIFADHHGQVVHLFERDCSLQRRHQKIIEEAPVLNAKLRQRLTEAAIAVARTINYTNAGTIEFLLDGEDFYFMEMNTRLQVEHPVTEMITGIDCVSWQLQIAAGKPLPLAQEQIHAKGHAIEARIYAEDSEQGFLPCTGTIEYLKYPSDQQSRFDTGIRQGDSISAFYDPMIAKLIVWDHDRSKCIKRLDKALADCHIAGIKTNIDFVRKLIADTTFVNGHCSTQFLNAPEAYLAQHAQVKLAAELASLYQAATLPSNNQDSDPHSPWGTHSAWQAHLAQSVRFSYRFKGETIDIDTTKLDIEYVIQDNTLDATKHESHLAVSFYENEQSITVFGLDEQYQLMFTHMTDHYHTENDANLAAPMPGTIVALFVASGDQVEAGDKLLVIEAMKMEHTIKAPYAGTVATLYYQAGDQVEEGKELIELTQG